MDVLQGVVDLVAPTLSPEQEQGLVDAIDEADRGDMVDGAAAFAKLRGRVRDAGAERIGLWAVILPHPGQPGSKPT